MSEFSALLAVTALVLMITILRAYRTTRDVLHPMIFLGPLFVYGTVLDPLLVRASLDRFFGSPEDVVFVLALNFGAVVALAAGALHGEGSAASRRGRQGGGLLSQPEGVLLLRIAFGLGVWGLLSYAIGIENAGGFATAYSRAKGGGVASSGYVTEGINLGLVAVAMAACARHRRGWTLPSLAAVGVGVLPNLLQGTFGGRRGPLFISLTALILAWVITRVRRPRLWAFWPGLAIAALAVIFVASQRQFLYLGSGESVRWDEFAGTVAPESTDEGNNFIYGAGFVTAVRRSGEYTWGRELAVNLLVRPIPRQLWPTKYEDAGATWVTSEYPGLGHLTRGDWLAAVGWLPLQGSSAISISDVFGEFGWGTIVVFYLIGRGFAELYRRRCLWGGMWQLLHLEALMLSIYLATQSFSAFYHRFLILAVPTVLVWRFVVEPRRARTVARRVRYAPARAPVNRRALGQSLQS
jgi:hypothetical protein